MTGAMLDSMIASGAQNMVANAATTLSRIEIAGHTLPLTRNDGALGNSYVCSPHSAYVLYAREELRLIDAGRLAKPARAAITGLDILLRRARINRIIHIGNWMLSTNLHGAWRGEGIAAARTALAETYSNHVLGVRSIDDWSSPGLRHALLSDGWILVPSRQIWVSDDLRRDWLPRHNFGNDRRLIGRSPLRVTDLPTVSAEDATRIAALYAQLYIGRYSPLNPILTPAFIQTSARTGMITYRAARDPHGTIMAVAGLWACHGIMTPPVVGYDTAQPRSEGLYRVATWMFMERALAAGWRLHASAGAAHFKRQRGARGVIEWNAYHARHLSRFRRFAIEALARSLTRIAVPMMIANGW